MSSASSKPPKHNFFFKTPTNFGLEIEVNRLFQQAITMLNQGRLELARDCLEKIIKLNPKQFDALNLLGIIAAEFKEFNLAESLFENAIKLNPKNAVFYCNAGNALKELKQFDKAIDYYDKAIKLKKDYALAYLNRSIALCELKQFEAALKSSEQAIHFNPDSANAYFQHGFNLQDLKRYDESLESYEKATLLKHDYAQAHSGCGNVLFELKRWREAIACYDKAIHYKNDFAEAYANRANALKELKLFDLALVSIDQSIQVKHDFAEAHYNRGNILFELKRWEEALNGFDKAIAFNSNYAEAYYNRGNVLFELNRWKEAIMSYQSAITLNPDYEYLQGSYQHIKLYVCDWQDYESTVFNILLQIKEGKKSTPAFTALALTDSPETQLKASKIWIDDKHPFNPSLGSIPKYQRKNKIRIGYYSADFHNHATAYLMAELFELHDKNKFEFIAFSFGPDSNHEIRHRLSKSFSQFLDVQFKSDEEIALLSRELEIDIAVDLKGLTSNARTHIFSYRAAPIQVNYIGFPGTMAAEYMDYIIADTTVIPAESQPYFVEKVVYLADSYQVNDRNRTISQKVFSRDELGLPEDSFVFCCFNNNYKINPLVFNVWVRILKAVEGSVLWLLEDNALAKINLRKEAEIRGLDPNRLVFAQRMDLPEHLARHRAADLFLDTFPYNAHTTASDALWSGLPVLTCKGHSFVSRVAASLLNAIEMPDLITETHDQYEVLAIELANNPTKFKAIKDRLINNRLNTPLFDTPLFTKRMESAYMQMYERYQMDKPPDHIYS
jgi:protein O-GlcNAc transferase